MTLLLASTVLATEFEIYVGNGTQIEDEIFTEDSGEFNALLDQLVNTISGTVFSDEYTSMVHVTDSSDLSDLLFELYSGGHPYQVTWVVLIASDTELRPVIDPGNPGTSAVQEILKVIPGTAGDSSISRIKGLYG